MTFLGNFFTYFDRVESNQGKMLEAVRFYAVEILLTMEYFHDKMGIFYQDLNPEHIFVQGDGHLKLLKFDFSETNIPSKLTFKQRKTEIKLNN